MIIIGIDPGYESIGYAVVETLPAGKGFEKGKNSREKTEIRPLSGVSRPLDLHLRQAGVVKTSAEMRFSARLAMLADDIEIVLQTYRGGGVYNTRDDKAVQMEVAIESLFFQKNQQTAMRVAEARGVLLLKVEQLGIPAYAYTPSQAKRAITGSGRSDKKTVMGSLAKFFPKLAIKEDNAADAVAIAICHAFARPLLTENKRL